MENQRAYKTSIRERDIEKYLRDEIRKVGGRAYKFVSPGNNGVPDRIIFLPGARVVFVETKAPGKAPTTLQAAQIAKIKAFGFRVYIVDSKDKVDELVREVRGK
jgi:Holliday junction resolvase